jgi:hypothetical protein
MQDYPGDYLILDQSSGERFVVPRSAAKIPGLPQYTKIR